VIRRWRPAAPCGWPLPHPVRIGMAHPLRRSRLPRKLKTV
jgi:hypothetical protein